LPTASGSARLDLRQVRARLGHVGADRLGAKGREDVAALHAVAHVHPDLGDAQPATSAPTLASCHAMRLPLAPQGQLQRSLAAGPSS
jgi:hypothetical protein